MILEWCIISFFGGMCLGVACCTLTMRVSYFNGVVDGYGFSKTNSREFEEAGEYLRNNYSERWPELRVQPKLNPTRYHEDWGDN